MPKPLTDHNSEFTVFSTYLPCPLYTLEDTEVADNPHNEQTDS